MDVNIEAEKSKNEKFYGSCSSVIGGKVKNLNIKDPETFSFGILHGLKYIFIPTQWSHWVWATGHSIRGSHSLLLLEYGR